MIDTWKEVAWNGVRFLTPPNWEVGQIGTRHIMLEDEAGTVMEVKWGPVKGTFSHKAHLKRLTALNSRRIRGNVAECPVPAKWQKALAGFDARGFHWSGAAVSGRGVILYCPFCRNAAILQFLQPAGAKTENTAADILASYRDHRQDARVGWSIFDIRVTLPESLQLSHYKFEAGKFVLKFSDGRQKISLHRWAPASVILSGRDLMHFAKSIPEYSGSEPHPFAIGGCRAVEWWAAPKADWRRRISRLKVKPSFFWLRLWHLQDQNRILGVWAESKRPLDAQLLNGICRDYESG